MKNRWGNTSTKLQEERCLKRSRRHGAAALMIMAALFAACMIMPVLASSKPSFPDRIDMIRGQAFGRTIGEETSGGSSGERLVVSRLKSSRKAVVEVSANTAAPQAIYLKAKKKGSSVVSFRVKVGSKTYRYRTKVFVWAKYQSPVKTLKIGKKNYAALFKASPYAYPITSGDLAGKLKLKPATGWVFKEYYFWDAGTHESTPALKVLPKRISISGRRFCYFTFQKKSTGQIQTICLMPRTQDP